MFSFNLHPAMVHFPITLLIVASVSGLLYLFWQAKPELRLCTWWAMAVGWLSALLAMITGLLDQGNLPLRPPYQTTLDWHITTGFGLLLVYGALLYQQWIYKPKKEHIPDEPVLNTSLLDEPSARIWLIILLSFGAFLVILSSWHGGQLVYEWGVNVRR